MRGRLVLAALLAATTVASVTACGGSSAQAFHPSGAVPTASLGDVPAAASRVVTAPGGFRFPSGVSVDYAPVPSGSATDRAVLAGYQGYVLSLWAAVLSHGHDTSYQQRTSGQAQAYVQHETAFFARGGRAVTGVIGYSATSVMGVYFGHGAAVSSCVNAAAFHVANARTGAVTGPVFPAGYARYREEVAEARRGDGGWYVTDVQSFPASTSQGAMCR